MKYLARTFTVLLLLSALSMSTFAGVIVSGEDSDASNTCQGALISDNNENSAQGVIVSGEDSDGSNGCQGVIVSGEDADNGTQGIVVSSIFDWDYWF